jgi:hypothetical protein
MSRTAREDEAIETWCEVVGQLDGVRVTIVERPDSNSPGCGGCDAIVERGGNRQVIEHTTIDAYMGRRQDDHRFRLVVAALEQPVAESFPDSWIEISVPAHAIPTGQNWESLRELLLHRVSEGIYNMAIAKYDDLSRQKFEWSDIPFPVWISRQALAGDTPACHVFRVEPENKREQLVAGLARALNDKSDQLRPYHDKGMRTVLLLDFDDVALLNQDVVAKAFAEAAQEWKSPNVIDEVYLADGRRRHVWLLPVKLGERLYPDLTEFKQFFSKQFGMTYGQQK